MSGLFDVAIVGGGINGTGIARDAAGRGLSVLLLEQGDLAGATSSASTKLIHGGLRYLEHREFRLVREALAEREVLLRAAPHIVWPLRFVLPHHAGLRPWWMIRAGLFLYDHLGGRRILPPTRVVDLRRDPAGAPLQPAFTARLRILRLLGRRRPAGGAECARCRVARGRYPHPHRLPFRPAGGRRLVAALSDGGEESRARVLVNAAGPWVSACPVRGVGQNAPTRVRMVKGSHIVVRRLFAARPLLHLPEPRRPDLLRDPLRAATSP